MNRFRVTRSVIPNLFTAMNMFSGFLSIINTAQGKYDYAAILIIIAAIFDSLDGIMARLTRSSSELGVELDSLSDVISFGAAPAFLIYSTYLHDFNAAGIVISSLLLIAGGFRLARFNVQLVGFDKEYFTGLPIPSSGITIAAFVLAYYEKGIGFTEPYTNFIIPLVLILSLVSKIKYNTIPKPSIKEMKKKPAQYTFIAAAIIILFVTSGKALFYIFVFIILFGIFRYIFNKFFRHV